jgi:hypothetical protein
MQRLGSRRREAAVTRLGLVQRQGGAIRIAEVPARLGDQELPAARSQS